jgi:hypothetical protein
MTRIAPPLSARPNRPLYGWLTACVLVVQLTACGGGGGGDGASSTSATPAQQPKAEFVHGLYKGTTDNGREFIALIAPTGRVYALSRSDTGPSPGTTLYFGNGIEAPATGGTFAFDSSGIRDFPIPTSPPPLKVETVTLDATVIQNNSIDGTLARTAADVKFTAFYDVSGFNEDTPALWKIEGAYSGDSVWGSTDEFGDSAITTITIATVGKITGTASGCPMDGEMAPHAAGNIYDITLRFRFGAQCSRGDIFTGHAIVQNLRINSVEFAVLYVWAANNGFSRVLFLAGSKPL